MAKQTINIGTTANDGTGDAIRAAFSKVNDNFTEIYTANTGVNTGDQNLSAYATTAAVASGYQPLDSDLTAISALTTTAYGRALLSTADAATLRSAIGVGTTDAPTFLAQTLTGQSLTGTQATSLVDLSATWNTTGTPSALKLNVTDTASSAASKLMDLQVGGVSLFSVEKNGTIAARASSTSINNNPTASPNGITFAGSNGKVYISSPQSPGNGLMFWQDNGAGTVMFLNNQFLKIQNTTLFQWCNADSGLTPSLSLAQDAAGILAQRNGTSAQAFRAYNTFTDTNNKEWGEFDWKTTANTLRIGTNHFGSGVARPIDFVTGGVARWQISAAGHLLSAGVTDNTYDIGASGANRPRNVFVGGYVLAASGGNGGYYIGAFGGISSIATGIFKWTNGAADGFDRFQLGGTTSAFPAIKRNGAGIEIRFADDSSYTTINASDYTGYNGGVAKMYAGGAGVFQAVSTGYFALSSSATNVFAGDTYLSRSAAGVWQMGTSSTNATADLRLRSVIQQPPATVTPVNNGDFVVEATSNTLLTFKFKGSDGTIRSGTMVVA